MHWFLQPKQKGSGLQDTAGDGLRGDHRALAAVWRLMTSGVASGGLCMGLQSPPRHELSNPPPMLPKGSLVPLCLGLQLWSWVAQATSSPHHLCSDDRRPYSYEG